MRTSPYRFCLSHNKKLKFSCEERIIKCNGDIGRKKCGLEFYDLEKFNEHVQQKHKKCQVNGCNYFAAARSTFRNHDIECHTEFDHDDLLKNPLKCPRCDFITRHPKVLNTHTTKIHKQSEAPRCKFCNITFDDDEKGRDKARDHAKANHNIAQILTRGEKKHNCFYTFLFCFPFRTTYARYPQ